MEHTNLPVAGNRIWNVVRAMLFMLRKGISKRKLMLDLNMMMKRGKIAGKAIPNLMFHFHHHSSASNRLSHGGEISFSGAPGEYEFSCSNSPAFPFNLIKRKHQYSHFFSCTHPPPTDDDDVVTANAVRKALEMLNSETASPAIAGFLQSSAVRDMLYSDMGPAMARQLRITDSPFPLRDVDGNSHVDKAAK